MDKHIHIDDHGAAERKLYTQGMHKAFSGEASAGWCLRSKLLVVGLAERHIMCLSFTGHNFFMENDFCVSIKCDGHFTPTLLNVKSFSSLWIHLCKKKHLPHQVQTNVLPFLSSCLSGHLTENIPEDLTASHSCMIWGLLGTFLLFSDYGNSLNVLTKMDSLGDVLVGEKLWFHFHTGHLVKGGPYRNPSWDMEMPRPVLLELSWFAKETASSISLGQFSSLTMTREGITLPWLVILSFTYKDKLSKNYCHFLHF